MTGTINTGRVCPLDYLYRPEDPGNAPPADVDTLYVVGGLYGNPFALHEIEKLVAAEQTGASSVKLVFNGDFNWFNHNGEDFDALNRTVLQHDAVRGNVETEISRTQFGGGCGCGYPASVSNEVVEWSNEIIDVLHQTASRQPVIKEALLQLPMFRRYRIGSTSVNVIHGDSRSLAGWSFSRQNLMAASASLTQDALAGNAEIIACTHTCEPFATVLGNTEKSVAIINNGSAGMPNLDNGLYGIISRISTLPAPMPCLYGTQTNSVYVDAIAVHYQQDELLDWFGTHWPEGSPAYRSYHERLTTGTSQTVTQSIGSGFSISAK